MERNDYLIRKKIYKYMLTGVMVTVALQLGNVVDAMIVGNLLGSIGNGAISASTPYIYTLQAATILLGSGGAVCVAVLLGKRDAENAGRVFSFCMILSVAYPLVFTCLSPFTLPLYRNMLGASGQLAEMVSSVTLVYSLGMPILSFVVVMAYLINVDNHPSISANMHITANVVNLVLDYILVKFTPLGITGAAMSTVLGYLVAGIIFIPMYYKSKDRMVTPVIKGLFSGSEYFLTTCKNGFPNLINLIMTVISVSLINATILRALGEGYFSAYAVVNNTQLIVQMFLNGISSVIASVAGVLYGEKDYFGMRKVFSRVLKSALIIGIAIMVIFLAFPQLIAGMYGFDNDDVRAELYMGLRLFSLSFCFFILNAISQNYYRTIGRTVLSTLSVSLEILLVRVPLMFLGMKTFGFVGLFGAVIISEIITFGLINLIRLIRQKLKPTSEKGFLMIPKVNAEEICDFTVKGSDLEAVEVSQRIIDYCMKEGLGADKAKAMGIAAEELISNIGRYGYKDPAEKYIDVCLSKRGDKFYMRLRDDGIPFDPVSYEPKEHEPYEIGGLEMLKKLAVKMTYMRVINLNNTIIEIQS